MQDTKKCDESRQLHYEGCLQEVRVEPGDIVGARSISSTSEEGRNGGNEYSSGLLEKILHRDNMNNAYRRVKENKGSHGVDGMSVNELLPYLKQNGNQIRQFILEGTYNPQPVRRVEIPKPSGGKRLSTPMIKCKKGGADIFLDFLGNQTQTSSIFQRTHRPERHLDPFLVIPV